MSELREENTSREENMQQYMQRKNTESGTEIETKISGLLSYSNFIINAGNE